MGAWLLSLVLVLGSQGPLQEPTPAPAVEQAAGRPAPADAEPARQAGLERWEALSEEERAVLRERFEALRKLSPEQRKALKERARALDEQRRELREGLDPELREHLDRLPPWERDRILREEQLAERKDRGRSLRGSLGPEHREWLEGLVEPGRPHPPEDVRARIHGRFGGRAIERLGEEGHLTDAQQARLEGLEGSARMDELFTIERERLEARVAADGLPEGVSEQAWAKALAEPSPERFLKRARRLGFEAFGPSEGRWYGRSDGRGGWDGRGGRDGWDNRDGRDGWGDKGGWSRHGPWSGPILPEGAPAWAAPLHEASRQTLEDRLEVEGLARGERHAAMDRLREARIRAVLPTLEGLPAEEAAALEDLTERDLVRAVDELLERHVFGGKRRDGKRWDGKRRDGERWDGDHRGGAPSGELGPPGPERPDGPPHGRGPGGRPDGRPEGPPDMPKKDGDREQRRPRRAP